MLIPSVIDSHVWLFRGAEGGLWLENFQRERAQQQDQTEKPRNGTEEMTLGDIHDPTLREVKKQKFR